MSPGAPGSDAERTVSHSLGVKVSVRGLGSIGQVGAMASTVAPARGLASRPEVASFQTRARLTLSSATLPSDGKVSTMIFSFQLLGVHFQRCFGVSLIDDFTLLRPRRAHGSIAFHRNTPRGGDGNLIVHQWMRSPFLATLRNADTSLQWSLLALGAANVQGAGRDRTAPDLQRSLVHTGASRTHVGVGSEKLLARPHHCGRR